jgi:hypothetical protein
LKRSDFRKGFPYDAEHHQSLYILRYYAAYFLENYTLFNVLKEDGLGCPVVCSMGCGCLVDAAAARHVFENVKYVGFDINEWHIKSVALDENTQLFIGDVFKVNSFAQDINVFMFPKSIGDLGVRIKELHNAINSSVFLSDVIYVCATYRASDGGLDNDRAKLRDFISLFAGYSSKTIYTFAGSSVPYDKRWLGHLVGCGFSHEYTKYCQSLLESCGKNEATCPTDVCREWVNRAPILRVDELAYEIVKLTRNVL